MPFIVLALLASPAAPLPHREDFTLEASAEVVVEFQARCPGCDWGRRGHEGVALTLSVDGAYSQHVFLVRGEHGAYGAVLGRLAAGQHALVFTLDEARSARQTRQATVSNVTVRPLAAGSSEERLVEHAPVLMTRPNALDLFSDLPLLMWVESEPTEAGGLRLRYSVVFSNEDGGTPADRLMATWGRITDIEYVLGVELDASGDVVREEFQGPGHELRPFAGVHEATHPRLHVVTDNNMVSDRGRQTARLALVPFPFDLSGTSREAVMDANPWTYAMAAKEARREGRVRADPRVGSGKIPDPRRFAVLEACAATKDAVIAFSLGLRGPGGNTHYFDSDAGLPSFRIGRRATEFPNGCFRGAVALPPGAEPRDVVSLRLRAFTRIPGKGEAPLAAGSGSVRLRRVNTLFFLGSDDQPGPGRFSWQGDVPLRAEGAPLELTVPN